MSKIISFGLMLFEQMNCNVLFGCLKTGEIYKYIFQHGIPIAYACEALIVTCLDDYLQLVWNSGWASKTVIFIN